MSSVITTEDGEAIYLRVRVIPRARKDRIEGVHANALKVRVAAPPVDGAANRAVLALLADALAIPKRQLRLVQGQRSREKVIAVYGLSRREIWQRLNLTPED